MKHTPGPTENCKINGKEGCKTCSYMGCLNSLWNKEEKEGIMKIYEHNHLNDGGYYPKCVRCNLNFVAPEMYDTLKELDDIASTTYQHLIGGFPHVDTAEVIDYCTQTLLDTRKRVNNLLTKIKATL